MAYPMQMRPVLLFDLLLGIALIATIGLAARRSPLAIQARRTPLVGWLLVAGPLPVVVAFRLLLPSSPFAGEGAFVCGVFAFALGALLVLSDRDDEEDNDGSVDLGPPPWWPDFEREFRAYARRRSHPRVQI